MPEWECCGPCLRRARSGRDDARERRRKELLIPMASSVGGLCLAMFLESLITHGGVHGMYSTGTGIVAGVLLGGLLVPVLVTQKLPLWLAETALVCVLPGVIACDLSNTRAMTGRPWPCAILVIDAMLTSDARDRPQILAIALVCGYLFVEELESMLLFGFYDLATFRDPSHENYYKVPGVCDCSEPPCAKVVMAGVLDYVFMVLVFVVDYYFTRSFAQGLRHQMATMEASVEVAEDIAVLLADYDTAAAEELVGGDAGAELPPRLRGALHSLLRNLKGYRAFLPQSCLPRECAGDDGAAAVTAGGGGGGPGAARGGVGAPDMVGVVSEQGSISVGSTAPRSPRSPRGRISVASSAAQGAPPSASMSGAFIVPFAPAARPSAAATPCAGMRASMASSLAGMAPRQQHTDEMSRRSVTLVAANLREYLSAALRAHGGSLTSFHCELLGRWCAAAAASKGLSDGVSGDRFYASVNAARPAVGHRAAGVRLGWALAADGAGAPGAAPRPGRRASAHPVVSPRGGLRASCGVCSGELRCGVVGCDTLRRYSVVGVGAAWVHVCERAASAWGARAVANGPARGDAAAAYEWRLRRAAVLRKPSHAALPAQRLWEAVRPASGQDASPDEWMYELERIEGEDPWRHWNAAQDAFYRSDFAGALRHVDAGREALGLQQQQQPDANGWAANQPPPPQQQPDANGGAGPPDLLFEWFAELAAAAARCPAQPYAAADDARVGAPGGASGDAGPVAAPQGSSPAKEMVVEDARDSPRSVVAELIVTPAEMIVTPTSTRAKQQPAQVVAV